MIIDLQRFVDAERPYWTELDTLLQRLETDPEAALTFEQAQRLHYLYQRGAADLARISTFSAEPRTRQYLESLVGRAYGEIYETRTKGGRPKPLVWFMQTLPQTFRRQIGAFWLSLAITIAGLGFGVVAMATDPEAKQVLMPFPHLKGNPRDRVAEEEKGKSDRLSGAKGSFSADLMTHNTRVAAFTMALGLSWGVGTLIMLFYNGVILGAVAFDYIHAGQLPFLLGWLLPHGVIEIPAILLGGQAGLVLASALIGWGQRTPRRQRLREVAPDVVTIMGGAAIMLVWAGIVESYLSQYHQPVIPYALKIGFGMVEFSVLVLFLSRAGADTRPSR